MIDSQLRVSGVNEPAVLAAFESVAREEFVPAGLKANAYIDRAIALDDGHFLPAPLVHGRMLTDYLAALAKALGAEYRAILDAGFTLQIDCPDLALERHGAWQDKPLSAFLDFSERVVAAINRAIAGLPRERIRMHVCWGNYECA